MKKKSIYKGVYYQDSGRRSKNTKGGYWAAQKSFNGKSYSKTCKTEREAAIAYDKMCLSFGLEPVNILVKR